MGADSVVTHACMPRYIHTHSNTLQSLLTANGIVVWIGKAWSAVWIIEHITTVTRCLTNWKNNGAFLNDYFNSILFTSFISLPSHQSCKISRQNQLILIITIDSHLLLHALHRHAHLVDSHGGLLRVCNKKHVHVLQVNCRGT